jgi:hypothetical protein
MEMPQENSLYSYHKQTKMLFLFFYKSGEQEGKQVLPGGLGSVGKGRMWGKVRG